MAINASRRYQRPKTLIPRATFLLFTTSLFLLTILYLSAQIPKFHIHRTDRLRISRPINPFDCYSTPQARPVIANTVGGLKFPFFYSLSDFGDLPDNPHKSIVRTLKGKPFRTPDISATVQELLGKLKSENRNGVFVDVGAHVGTATFAAAVMGFKVLAFEPVLENLQRICEGIFFNRVGHLVQVFEAAVSDLSGNITVHKLVGQLDHSAVSAARSKVASTSNEKIGFPVKSVAIDEVILPYEPVVVLKIDVQGWEHHVLKGASKLLSRNKRDAPYVIYEEDDHLLGASNSSAKEIRAFLQSTGYHHCVQHGTDAICSKTE